MSTKAKTFRRTLAAQVQWVASSLVAVAALALGLATLAGVLGYLPVLTLPLQFGDTIYPQAGLAIQVGLAIFLLAVVACLPSGLRVLDLERTHRDFSITMSDVAEAYRICHAADRQGVFTLSEQFDAVKERILYLRQHPDLGNLEPDVLEAASEMSYASRDLAETYSDENVARARGFLAHRQEEAALFEDRFERALKICRDLRRQRDAVAMDGDMMDSRMSQLEDEFGDLLRDLGFTRSRTAHNIIAMPAAAHKGMAAE
ncbi:DNA repair protein [Maribius pontilimi]|uniref:DNA repair protein n=1 Tax=Palleronia pontilimi TaxID=1964209 RepID=A0A934M980_9RHOB|nr:DNA repair protein [Palleronia pontilimi]MBJ3762242.1 DNA repair protein [Palleronia pontilimi]